MRGFALFAIVAICLCAVTTVRGLRVGEFATLVDINNGFPGVAYFDRFFGRTRWTLSTREIPANATAWRTPVFSAIRYNVGLFLDAIVVNGNPAMSYFNVGKPTDEWEGSLMYNRANGPQGATGWTPPQLVDNEGNVGQFTSMKIVDGNPAISYYDDTIHFGGCKYVRAEDANGDVWGTPVFIEKRSFVGLYTQLGVLNSGPAIAYYSLADGDLRFSKSTDTRGQSWETPVILDRGIGDVGKHTSMSVSVDGIPSIAYYDNNNHNLWFIRATDATANAWATPVQVDSQRYTGRFASITHLSDGRPAIAYFANEVHELRFKRALDTTGNTWDADPVYVDPPVPDHPTSFLTHAISLKVIAGRPIIAYYEQVAADLKVAVSTHIYGNNNTWTLHVLDRGTPPNGANSVTISVTLLLFVVVAALLF